MLISLFSFKTLEEYFLLRPFFPSARRSTTTYAAHFYSPCKGGQRDRNLGIRSIMDGSLLIREKEIEQENEGETGRGSKTAASLMVWLNTACSQQQVWSDLVACFVRSVVTLLTRSVLTQTSPSSAT